jgi:hypothetical protein
MQPEISVELPPPSAELVLIREITDWYLASLPRREAERARAELAERFAQVESIGRVVPIRPRPQHAAVARARREAAAWFRAAFLRVEV